MWMWIHSLKLTAKAPETGRYGDYPICPFRTSHINMVPGREHKLTMEVEKSVLWKKATISSEAKLQRWVSQWSSLNRPVQGFLSCRGMDRRTATVVLQRSRPGIWAGSPCWGWKTPQFYGNDTVIGEVWWSYWQPYILWGLINHGYWPLTSPGMILQSDYKGPISTNQDSQWNVLSVGFGSNAAQLPTNPRRLNQIRFWKYLSLRISQKMNQPVYCKSVK